MRTVRWGAGVGALVAALVLVGASCGDDDDDGGQAAAPQIDPDPLNLEIQSVTIPTGENVRPVVRFRVTDASGAPIDLPTEIAASIARPAGFPNTVPRFTFAQLDDRGNYTSYYAANVQPTTVNPDTLPPSDTPPVPAAATQATSKPTGTWPVSDLTPAGNGFYDFTLPPTEVTGLDRTKTHTLAGWVERKRTSLDSDIAHSSFNFVPEGGAAPQRDEVISDAACNQCHGVVQAHGTRRGTQLCITCHSPQTTDPETSRTVDFQVMIHKIHMGRDLPSVQHAATPDGNGNPYYIVGRNGAIHDYSLVAFPYHDGVQHCSVCHQGGEDADNWRQRPSITACTSCHDNVKFEAGAAATSCNTLPASTPLADCLHTGGAVAVANQDDFGSCASCHAPGSPLGVDRFHHGE